MNFPQLVKFDNDWADEFSLTTFAVMEHKEIEKLLYLVELYFSFFPGKIIEIYFGTNEFFVFEDYKSFRNSFEIVNLTEQEVKSSENCFRLMRKILLSLVTTFLIVFLLLNFFLTIINL